MEKKQQIPGLNAESRTRGMLKGFDNESVQECDFRDSNQRCLYSTVCTGTRVGNNQRQHKFYQAETKQIKQFDL